MCFQITLFAIIIADTTHGVIVYNNPYALTYPYYHHPALLALKHHHPDHKEEDAEKDTDTDKMGLKLYPLK